jgi:hypothetical protein
MPKTYEEYLDDPRIKDEPMGLRMTHAMRFVVQDKIEGMTPEERTAYYSGSAVRLLGEETAARLLLPADNAKAAHTASL